jgi:hypothetical protein
MAMNFHALAEEALALDPSDRLRLASELIDSVDGPEDAEWASAWTSALQERSLLADEREARGEARGADWADVRRRLLAGLARR